MKSGIIIAIIIGIVAIGVIYYSMNTEETSSQEIINVPDTEEPMVPEGKNLSISLKESIGIEATP